VLQSKYLDISVFVSFQFQLTETSFNVGLTIYFTITLAVRVILKNKPQTHRTKPQTVLLSLYYD